MPRQHHRASTSTPTSQLNTLWWWSQVDIHLFQLPEFCSLVPQKDPIQSLVPAPAPHSSSPLLPFLFGCLVLNTHRNTHKHKIRLFFSFMAQIAILSASATLVPFNCMLSIPQNLLVIIPFFTFTQIDSRVLHENGLRSMDIMFNLVF